MRSSITKLVLWLLAGALAVAVCVVGSSTLDSQKKLSIEQSVTPTPTADVSSMLRVTYDPQNTPSPTPVVLSAGSANDEVRRLQERLLALGYYTGGVDGQFGPGTKNAVIWFQQQHGLKADGMAGSATLDALYGAAAQTAQPTPSPTPTPTPVPEIGRLTGDETLAKGSKGEAVVSLQTRLQELGFLSGKADGDYGAGTEQAVRVFQRQHGLQVDGAAGPQTIKLLLSSQAQALVVTPTPDPGSMPMLVNKENMVPSSYAPDSLVRLRDKIPSSVAYIKGSDIEGDPTAVAALKALFEAAIQDGVTDWQVSAGYRSYKYQKRLFDDSVNEYIEKGRTRSSAISATKLTIAEPGASEHHTGLAFDITTPGTTFKGTPQQKWLQKHCWDHGFVIRYAEDKEKITGFIAECWHIRYVGTQHSLPMRDQNLCLEEYNQLMMK